MTTPFFSVIPLWRMTEIYDIYDKAMCDAVTRLAKRADIISPNLTELCVLTGESYEALSSSEPDDIAKAASSLLNDTLSTVIVTGIKKDDTVLNVVADKSGFKTVSSKKYGGSFPVRVICLPRLLRDLP